MNTDTKESSTGAICIDICHHLFAKFLLVVFHPLGQSEIRSIAQAQLQLLYKRLEERDYGIELSEEALDHLAKTGFDPVFGARPLKRAIQHELENPLAQKILAGDLKPGQTIHVSMQGDQLVIA